MNRGYTRRQILYAMVPSALGGFIAGRLGIQPSVTNSSSMNQQLDNSSRSPMPHEEVMALYERAKPELLAFRRQLDESITEFAKDAGISIGESIGEMADADYVRILYDVISSREHRKRHLLQQIWNLGDYEKRHLSDLRHKIKINFAVQSNGELRAIGPGKVEDGKAIVILDPANAENIGNVKRLEDVLLFAIRGYTPAFYDRELTIPFTESVEILDDKLYTNRRRRYSYYPNLLTILGNQPFFNTDWPIEDPLIHPRETGGESVYLGGAWAPREYFTTELNLANHRLLARLKEELPSNSKLRSELEALVK